MAREQRERLPDWESHQHPAPTPPVMPPDCGVARAAEALVRFDAERILRAIAFHLLDERLASSVAPDSFGVMLSRLRRRCLCLALPRPRWTAMTHRQRLDWLMSESGCGFILTGNRVAVLGQAGATPAPDRPGS